jgi:hypothetical protein
MSKRLITVLCCIVFQSVHMFITEITTAGGKCIFVNMSTFRLSSHTTAVK